MVLQQSKGTRSAAAAVHSAVAVGQRGPAVGTSRTEGRTQCTLEGPEQSVVGRSHTDTAAAAAEGRLPQHWLWLVGTLPLGQCRPVYGQQPLSVGLVELRTAEGHTAAAAAVAVAARQSPSATRRHLPEEGLCGRQERAPRRRRIRFAAVSSADDPTSCSAGSERCSARSLGQVAGLRWRTTLAVAAAGVGSLSGST